MPMYAHKRLVLTSQDLFRMAIVCMPIKVVTIMSHLTQIFLTVLYLFFCKQSKKKNTFCLGLYKIYYTDRLRLPTFYK